MTVDSVGNRTQDLLIDSVSYAVYENELQMPDIMKLIQKDLSEPYSIYTYRYFIHNWPHLCYMVRKFCQKLIYDAYSNVKTWPKLDSYIAKGGLNFKNFHVGSNLSKKVPNHFSEHYPPKDQMLKTVIWHLF